MWKYLFAEYLRFFTGKPTNLKKLADDSERTVSCLGTRVSSKGALYEDDPEDRAVFCFSPLLISRSDSKKSLSGREDYEASKTPWPVPSIEALFLPEFKVDYGKAGRYLTVRELGGSFGCRVFETIERFSGQRFALKILPKSKIVGDNAVRQAKEEVEIGRMIGHHQFIVNQPVYWQNRRNLYLATSWESGGDLHDLVVKYGHLPEELSRIYIAQTSVALEFLHSTGVVYRDLKAENVLLNGLDLSVRLSDFGLAKRLKRGARTKTMCGSPVYAAPEIGISDCGYDHAVDWWSLGVLTHVLLIGQLPELDCVVKFGSLSDSISKGINSQGFERDLLKKCDSPLSTLSRNTVNNNNRWCTTNETKIDFIENVPSNGHTRRSPCNSLAFDLSDEKLSSASRDLIRRLTNFDPNQRPKSALALSKLAFFVGLDLTNPEVANRVSPRLLVDRLVARKDQTVEMTTSDVVFYETDVEMFPVIV